MADDISPKDLLGKLDVYHAEIVALARETTDSVAVLKAATAKVEASEAKWWNIHKPLVTIVGTFAVLLLFVVGVAIIMSHTDLCIVNVGDNGKSATITSCKNLTDH